MKLPFSKIAGTESETAGIAHSFSKIIKAGDVISLNGNLGAGKTFFIKRVAEEFNAGDVNSPTFALVNEYEGIIHINHFDFYRINSVQELYDIGFNDYLNNTDSISFIEWGNLFPEILPKRRYEIDIIILEGSKRKIEIVKYE
ncbi:MAG: tRNA (adenosine(37)-N6)-threonylcarbamoyltransferase complex ATPase subunit type 1 TsaE [Ignavibacteriaceae bacterium]|nr:tRNA (adenosine(37)-N6)-threonylcarbamoyltransferase complex ATPase subunit type 1 TsaE [Ignavibacteriaceae bacterium]